MTSAISQLVYMPNFRAIGQSVWEKNGNTQKHRNTERQTETHTHLNFIKIDNRKVLNIFKMYLFFRIFQNRKIAKI